MDDYALVLNAGSSSLKFCVYARPPDGAWRLEARGQIEGIGTAPRLSAKDGDGERLVDQELDASVRDGGGALDALAAWLRSRYGGARVLGVGHRVVHGGARFRRSRRRHARTCSRSSGSSSPWPPSISRTTWPPSRRSPSAFPASPRWPASTPRFHRGQPAVAELVPLPRDIRQDGVQRYGFHGLSYEYVASVLPEIAPEIAHGRVVVAHLGSGASLCALRNGKSVDSSFGFTALDGLCMGTRPGALDPGVVLHLFQGLGLSAKEVETLLYKKSGLLGISGISNDMRDLLGSPEPGARLAVDYFVYQAAKQIGALAAVLQGLDGLVFTAGIGENSPRSGAASARPAPGWASRSTRRRTRERGPRISNGGQPGLGLGHPDQRGADDRPAHRAVAGARPGPRLIESEERRGVADGFHRTAGDQGARTGRPLAGVPKRSLAEADRRPGFHPAELRAVRG